MFQLIGLAVFLLLLPGTVPAVASEPAIGGWFYQATGSSDLRDIAFSDATHGWAVGGGIDPGRILATTDGGNGWSVQIALYPHSITSVCFSDATHGWALVPPAETNTGTVLATTNGGATWAVKGTWSEAALRKVTFADTAHGWAVGDDGAILATTDGGATWLAQTSGSREDLKDVAFLDSRRGWAVGWYGTILATTDGGASWSAQYSNRSALLEDIDFVDATHGWAVGWLSDSVAFYGPGILLATTDGGATWSEESYGSDAMLYGVDFIDASHGWIVGELGAGGDGAILATTNGGATWTAQISGSQSALSDVTFADATHGWALAEGMVIATTTGGFFPPMPTISSVSPASGNMTTRVTLTGTHFTGATAVAFNGTAAHFTVASASEISAGVPPDATSGRITVNTPGGTATSDASFTVIGEPVWPTVTLKLSGLKRGAITLGKNVTAKGTATPTSLAGSTTTLTLQKKRGTKWVKAKSSARTISATGSYSWKYKPAKKRAYRVQAKIAKTTAHEAAATPWRTFRVK